MDEFYQSFAPNQEYTDEYIQQLRDEDLVVFCHGVHAVRIIPRDGMNPLFEILGEDDGQLFSYDHAITFDSYWTLDLIKTLAEAMQYWEIIRHNYNHKEE